MTRSRDHDVTGLIIGAQSQLASKITGMLLEGLDTAELLGLVESPLALDEKIKLALEALQKHSRAQKAPL